MSGAEATMAGPVRRMLHVARPMRWTMVVAVLAGAGTVACGIALLAVSGWLIARASEHPNEVALAVAVVAVRAFGIGRGVLRYVERLASHDTAFRVLTEVRGRVYDRLERVAPAGLRDLRSADLLGRLVSDVDAVQDLFIRGVTPPLVAALVGAGTVLAATAVFAPVGLVLGVGLLVAGVLVPWAAVRLSERLARRQAAARSTLTVGFADLVDGSAELVAFGQADAALARLDAADERVLRLARRAAGVSAFGTGAGGLVAGLTAFAVLLVAVDAQSDGGLSRVGLAALVLTALAAFEATTPMTAAAQQFAAVRAGARRVVEVLDAPDPVRDPAVPLPLPTQPVHLEMRGVRLRYAVDAPWALDAVNLDLPPGRRVALVGPSGAGKSTVASVLLRFREIDSGAVTLDGVPLASYAADDVRRVVGGCLADAHVFDSTLRENLRLARPDATQAELDDVADRVRLLDWIRSLPLGWETPVGSHGAEMSGGQRQRLVLARALLADFPVLVLDEPTAHLDPVTRDELIDDILRVTRGRTLLLITHDPTRLRELDEIVTLDHGRVTHREAGMPAA